MHLLLYAPIISRCPREIKGAGGSIFFYPLPYLNCGPLFAKQKLADGLFMLVTLVVVFLVNRFLVWQFDTKTMTPMIFVLGVFLVSWRTQGYGFGIASSLISVLAVNWAFTYPYWAFDLIGFLMFGNLIRECGVLDSLSETAQKVLANLITIFLGITIASQMKAADFCASIPWSSSAWVWWHSSSIPSAALWLPRS